jgi:hypothetical protein
MDVGDSHLTIEVVKNSPRELVGSLLVLDSPEMNGDSRILRV